jgi:hypothetical protein
MTAYDKVNWVTHEIIHTDDMNHLETGIYTAHNEIDALTLLMEENNYINRTVTQSGIAVDANGGTATVSDVYTRSGSAICVEIQNKGASTAFTVDIYGKVGTLPYTTDPVVTKDITSEDPVSMIFVTPPQDYIKIIITNTDAENASTFDIVVRVLGNIAFMLKAVYDTDADDKVEKADVADFGLQLAVSGTPDGPVTGKSYTDITNERNTAISTHAANATIHHTNANDPNAGQKAALAGTNGTPGSDNKYVTNSDTRMTDSRTPLAHAHTCTDVTDIATSYEAIISSKGTAFNKNFGSTSGTVCEGNDSRLSDTRTPSNHRIRHIKYIDDGTEQTDVGDGIRPDNLYPCLDNTRNDTSTERHGLCPKLGGGTTNFLRADGVWAVPPGGDGSGNVVFGDGPGECCEGNDVRLSNDRYPTSHKSSHYSGGLDAIKLDDFAEPDDNTDLNASPTKHGLCPKLGGGTSNFLRADGTWAAPTNVTPALHAASHKSGQSDVIKLDELGAPTNTNSTTLNASTTVHGLCPKLSNDITQFLNGQGSWTAPAGTWASNFAATATTGKICEASDSRLSNSRTPISHALSHKSGGDDALKLDELAVPTDTNSITLNASTTVHGLCPKLSNVPTQFLNGQGSWIVPAGTWASNFASTATAGKICEASDSRLSNSRAPTVHASTHSSGSTDPVSVENLVFNNLTTNDSSSTKHGLCPKLSGIATQYLNGNGAWTTPTTSVTYGTTAGTACQGNDSRLSNARVPTFHASEHYLMYDHDVVYVDFLGLADGLDNNTSTARHGLCPKLPGNIATFLRGDGEWGTPGGIITTCVRWEEGNLSTNTYFMPYLVTSAKTISSVKGYVMVLPVGANILFDIRKNNPSLTTASIFASDAAQSIATNLSATNMVYQFNFSAALDAAMTSCVAGDVLYFTITQVGSTTPGTAMYFEVAF